MDDRSTTEPALLGNAPKLGAERAASLEARLFGGAKRENRIRQYVIRERIGAGAHGLVYRAFDTRLKRSVALKEVRVGSGRTLRRLEREAQSLARLSHPNVVQVHECGLVGDARFFIAMEFVDGPSLDRWLRDEPRPREDVLTVFARVADGLAALHRQGLVHRDVKPANIIVGTDRVPKLVDLGLASSVADEDDHAVEAPRDTLASTGAGADASCGEPSARFGADTVAATPARLWPLQSSVSSTWAEIDPDIEVARTFGFAGTPRFAAPEQFVGLAAEPRTDQFSFFVSLFAAVVGEHPFSGKTYAELARQVVGGEIAWPERGLPRGLRRVLQRGLSVRAESRFASMEDVADAIRGLERRSPLRRVVPWAASALIATTAVAFVAEPEPVDCAAILNDFQTGWAQDEAALRTRIEADAGSRAASVAIDQLDRWSERWVHSRASACQAQREERPAAPATVACLHRGRDAFEVLVTTLERELDVTAEPDAVPTTMRLGVWLAEPSACESDPQTWPERSDDAARVYDRLARVRVLRLLGRWIEAQTLAAQVSAEAHEAGAPDLASLTDALRGELLLRLGERDAGVRLLEETLLQAETHGQTLVSASVRAELGIEAAKRGEASSAVLVRAGLARLEAEAALGGHAEAELLAALSRVEAHLGHHQASVDVGRRALSAFEALFGEADSRTAANRLNLGGALIRIGQHDEAAQHLDAGWRALTAALGLDHPLVARHALSTAKSLMNLERWDDAAHRLTVAIDAAQTHPMLTRVLTDAQLELAYVHVRMGEAVRAPDLLDETRPEPASAHAKRWADVALYAYDVLQDRPAAAGAAQLALDVALQAEPTKPAAVAKAAVRLVILLQASQASCAARRAFDRHADLIEDHHPSYAARFVDELADQPSDCKDRP